MRSKVERPSMTMSNRRRSLHPPRSVTLVRIPGISERWRRFIHRSDIRRCRAQSQLEPTCIQHIQEHALTMSAAPRHTPFSVTVSYLNRGPHIICKCGCIRAILSWFERSTADM